MATQAALRPRERPPPRAPAARWAEGAARAGPSAPSSPSRGGGASSRLVRSFSEAPGAPGSLQLPVSCSGVCHSRGGRDPPGVWLGLQPRHRHWSPSFVDFWHWPPIFFPRGPPVPAGCLRALPARTPEGSGQLGAPGLPQHGRELWRPGGQWAGADWEQLCQPRGQHPSGANPAALGPLPLLRMPSPLQRLGPAAGHTAGGCLKYYECNILLLLRLEITGCSRECFSPL